MGGPRFQRGGVDLRRGNEVTVYPLAHGKGLDNAPDRVVRETRGLDCGGFI
jgi:hypothetical protein